MRRAWWTFCWWTFWTLGCLILTGPLAEAAVQNFVAVQPAPLSDQDARVVRNQFRDLMNQQPDTLREIFQLDPTLMTDADYMEPYPDLVAFLGEHPEIARNPAYFVGTPRNGSSDIGEPLIAMTVFLIIFFSLSWLIRTLIDYIRWNRAARVQAETHAKLLDRFTANQDLLAYIDTPAGRRFLESAPFKLGAGNTDFGAPIRGVMFSMQAGLVLGLGGLGLHFAIPRLTDTDMADALFVMGTLAVALGIGFVFSALTAIVLSRRLGLINRNEDSQTDVGT